MNAKLSPKMIAALRTISRNGSAVIRSSTRGALLRRDLISCVLNRRGDILRHEVTEAGYAALAVEVALPPTTAANSTRRETETGQTDKRVLDSVVRLHRAIDDQVRNDRKTVDDHFPIVDEEAVTCGTCNNQPWPCLATTKVAIRYGLNPNTLDTE